MHWEQVHKPTCTETCHSDKDQNIMIRKLKTTTFWNHLKRQMLNAAKKQPNKVWPHSHILSYYQVCRMIKSILLSYYILNH